MIEAIGPFNTGAAVGGDGVATANATSTEAVTGQLLGFYVKYNGSPPAGTTDVTIETTGGIIPGRTILTISNAATDGFFAVRLGVVSTANAAITDSHVPAPLARDKIKVTIAGANAADTADVWAVVMK